MYQQYMDSCGIITPYLKFPILRTTTIKPHITSFPALTSTPMTVVERKSYYAGYTSQIAILGLITIYFLYQYTGGGGKLKLENSFRRASNLKFLVSLQKQSLFKLFGQNSKNRRLSLSIRDGNYILIKLKKTALKNMKKNYLIENIQNRMRI